MATSRSNSDLEFWANVEPTGFCWLWTGGSVNRGYGVFHQNYKTLLVHRKSYELLVGPIPEGLTLDHLCRIPLCVNPDHLEPVTMRVNNLRSFGLAAQNARKTHCKNGHEFTATNTAPRNRPGGGRTCRECNRLKARKHREQKILV